jgi:hypothetical protein
LAGSKIDADATIDTGAEGSDADAQLKALAAEIDLDPKSLRDTLEAAMADPWRASTA